MVSFLSARFSLLNYHVQEKQAIAVREVLRIGSNAKAKIFEQGAEKVVLRLDRRVTWAELS